jgi:assimilatory nitrate reductase catalytic subunit
VHQNEFNELLGKLDFLVVQDLYHTTATAQHADLILPAAGWGEKEGTFINSERRIGLVKKVTKAPGQALADFHILQLIAHYWGCSHLFARWSSPEAVFQLLKEISRDQPCDITGVTDYHMIDERGGIQWPVPEGVEQPETERRLFSDGRFFHADGRARFLFDPPRDAPEMADEEYPFILLSGRGSSAQWHTGTRTDKSDVLRKLGPNNIYVEINPADARKYGIESGADVRLTSRRAEITASAFVTPTVSPGQLFIPMHYETMNRLLSCVYDPYSRQPSFKCCAVRVALA